MPEPGTAPQRDPRQMIRSARSVHAGMMAAVVAYGVVLWMLVRQPAGAGWTPPAPVVPLALRVVCAVGGAALFAFGTLGIQRVALAADDVRQLYYRTGSMRIIRLA